MVVVRSVGGNEGAGWLDQDQVGNAGGGVGWLVSGMEAYEHISGPREYVLNLCHSSPV